MPDGSHTCDCAWRGTCGKERTGLAIFPCRLSSSSAMPIVIGSNHVTQSEVMAKRIPNAEYRYLEGQSHGFFWQAPEETNAWVLDWINRHS